MCMFVCGQCVCSFMPCVCVFMHLFASLSLSLCMFIPGFLQVPKEAGEGVGSSSTGVIGGYQMLSVDAGMPTNCGPPQDQRATFNH